MTPRPYYPLMMFNNDNTDTSAKPNRATVVVMSEIMSNSLCDSMVGSEWLAAGGMISRRMLHHVGNSARRTYCDPDSHLCKGEALCLLLGERNPGSKWVIAFPTGVRRPARVTPLWKGGQSRVFERRNVSASPSNSTTLGP